jgi:hypothetical protein
MLKIWPARAMAAPVEMVPTAWRAVEKPSIDLDRVKASCNVKHSDHG